MTNIHIYNLKHETQKQNASFDGLCDLGLMKCAKHLQQPTKKNVNILTSNLKIKMGNLVLCLQQGVLLINFNTGLYRHNNYNTFGASLFLL